MKKVTIYSTRICPYCVRAKNFFDKKDIAYEDIMVDMDQEQLRIMMEKSKRQSVPQIFIGDYHVGGFDDLIEHDMDGKLEDLLICHPYHVQLNHRIHLHDNLQ